MKKFLMLAGLMTVMAAAAHAGWAAPEAAPMEAAKPVEDPEVNATLSGFHRRLVSQGYQSFIMSDLKMAPKGIVTLEAGKEYVLVGVCGKNCKNVSMTIVAPNGMFIRPASQSASGVAQSKDRFAEWTVKDAGKYRFSAYSDCLDPAVAGACPMKLVGYSRVAGIW